MTTTSPQSGYAPVNGLNLYYEIHGSGDPLILMHGGISTLDTDFAALLPVLAEGRQVIGVELQGHGRTADVDRPLRFATMADDIAALIAHLGLKQADLFGFSVGAGVALDVAIRYPDLVRKVVLATVSYTVEGEHTQIREGMQYVTPEVVAGSPYQLDYARLAPHPENWASLLEKIKEMSSQDQEWAADAIRAIKAPVLLIFGDADIVRLEHAVELFQLLGGGVPGDVVGLPASQLAILPGTTHTMLMQRTDLLRAIVPPFLNAPMPDNAEA